MSSHKKIKIKHKKLILSLIIIASLTGLLTVSLLQPQQTPPFLPATQTGGIQATQTLKTPTIQNLTYEDIMIEPSALENSILAFAQSQFNETFFNLSIPSGVTNIIQFGSMLMVHIAEQGLNSSAPHNILLISGSYPVSMIWNNTLGAINVWANGTDTSAVQNCNSAMNQLFNQFQQKLSTTLGISIQKIDNYTQVITTTFGPYGEYIEVTQGILTFNSLNTSAETYNVLEGLIPDDTFAKTIVQKDSPSKSIIITDGGFNFTGTFQKLAGITAGAIIEGQIGKSGDSYTLSLRNLLQPAGNITSQASSAYITINLPVTSNINAFYPSTAFTHSSLMQPALYFSTYEYPFSVEDVNVTYTLEREVPYVIAEYNMTNWNMNPGDTANLTVTLKNVGTTTAYNVNPSQTFQNATVMYFTDTMSSGSPISWSPPIEPFTLAPGESKVINHRVTANNTGSTTIQVQHQFRRAPDGITNFVLSRDLYAHVGVSEPIIMYSIDCSDWVVRPGDPVSVYFTVRNVGTQTANNFTAPFIPNLGPIIDSNVTLPEMFQSLFQYEPWVLGDIPAGQSITVNMTSEVDYYSFHTGGLAYPLVMAAVGGYIPSLPLTLPGLRPATAAHLEYEKYPEQVSFSVDDLISVSVKVKNLGTETETVTIKDIIPTEYFELFEGTNNLTINVNSRSSVTLTYTLKAIKTGTVRLPPPMILVNNSVAYSTRNIIGEPLPPNNAPTVDRISVESAYATKVWFSCEVSDPEGDPIIAYEWDLGDGTNSTDPKPYHEYTNEGTYIVSLRVQDSLGDWSAYKYLTINVSKEKWINPTITDGNYLTNLNITINGNLTITETGALHLTHCILNVNNGTNPVEYGITVYGGLYINESSTITAINPNNPYYFTVYEGAAFQMNDSKVEYCGHESGSYPDQQGLTIRADNAWIENNTFTKGGNGLIMYGSQSSTILNNNATDNVGWIIGFRLDNCLYNNLTGNIATNNWVGFQLINSSYNNLTGNIAKDNILDGFNIYNSSYNNLTGNNAINNGRVAFRLHRASNNTLMGNTATDSGLYGFELVDSANNRLEGNKATNNKWPGFWLERSSYNILSDNTATGSVQGFYLTNSSNNTLTGNTAKDNTFGFALYIYSSYNTLSGNTASNNHGAGFLIFEDTSYNNITGNTATNNDYQGFYLYKSSYNTLLGNTATNNHEHGFYLDKSSYNLLSGNTAIDNAQHGFYLSASSNNTLTGNTAIDNDRGFWLYVHSNNNNLTGNTATNNNYGFYLEWYSHNNNITGNTAVNCTTGYYWTPDSINNDFTGSVEAYYLRVKVTDVPGYPIPVADVLVETDENMQLFSATDQNGVTPWLAVPYKTFTTNDTMTENTTTVTVYYQGFHILNNPRIVYMSISHVETFQVTEYREVTWTNPTITNLNISQYLYITLNGNLTITETGKLHLTHCILNVNNGTTPVEYGITVYGGMYINESSTITAINPNNPYYFTVYEGAAFQMNDSRVEYCGHESGSWPDQQGLTIRADNAWIENNTITHGYNCLLLYGSQRSIILNNIAKDNIYGFILNSSSYNSLLGNTATNNHEHGFYLYNSSYNSLSGNTATNNDYHGFRIGSDSNNNVLSGNGAMNNGIDGFFLIINSNNNVLSSNWAINNGGNGFFIYSSSHNDLWSNIAIINLDNGFYLRDCWENTLWDNLARDNGDNGFRLLDCANNELGNNRATNNTGGFLLSNSKDNTLTYNDASNNLYSGFVLSSGSNNNTLTGNTATDNGYNGFQLFKSLNNQLLSGNNASNNYQYGFYLSESSNNILSDNIAHNNTKYGFYLELGSNNNTLKDNQANDNEYGFYLTESLFNTLLGNLVPIGAYLYKNHGFYLYKSSYNNLSGNYVGNHFTGFYLIDCSNNNLTDNLAASNEYGFYLEESSNNTLVGNRALNNFGIGFRLISNSNNNLIMGNTATKNYGHGFGLYSSSYNTLLNNTAISSRSRHGFYLADGSNNNVLTGNNATNCAEVGFYLRNNANNNLLSNNTAKNNLRGFYLYENSNNNTLTANTAVNNSQHGFWLYDSSKNNLTDNIASNNNIHGFYLYSGSNNNLLSGNTATNNKEYGFYLYKSSYNTLLNNNARDNLRGFYLRDNSNNNLTDNNATHNDYGFYLRYSWDNILTGNNATKNEYFGFRLDYGKEITIGNIVIGYEGNNTLTNNTATFHTYSPYDNGGFYLLYSWYNNLEGNDAIHNEYGFYLLDSRYNNLEGNDANKGYTGFYLDDSNNNHLTGNNATQNTYGFRLEDSSNNNLEDNTAVDSSIGFALYTSSDNNDLIGNTAIDNHNRGFSLYDNAGNNLEGNTVTDRYPHGYGFLLHKTVLCTLSDNTATNNIYGFYLDSSNLNTLSENTAVNSTYYGFYLSKSSLNTLTDKNCALNCATGYYWSSDSIHNIFTGSICSNYLRVNVTDIQGFPIPGADIETWTQYKIGDTTYKTISGGTTDQNGVTALIALPYKVYITQIFLFEYHTTVTEFDSLVTVYYQGFPIVDNEREVSMSSSHVETFQVIDNADPVVVITAPSSDSTVNTGGIWINGTFEGTGSNVINITINDTRFTLVEPSGPPYGVTGTYNFVSSVMIGTSEFDVEIVIEDAVGRTGTATRHVIVDQNNPDCAITEPPTDGTFYTGGIWINGTFNETGSQVISIAINDSRFTLIVPVGAGPYGVSGSFSFVALITEEGEFGVEVTVWDQAGLTGTATRHLMLLNNTPTGEDVEVTDPVSSVNVTFDNVTDSGTTIVTTNDTGPAPPEGFNVSGSYYNITTTSNYTGNITIAIPYDESQISVPEEHLKLMHWDEELEIWVDVTTWVDVNNNIVYGAVTSFSVFMVMEPMDVTPPITSIGLSGTLGLNSWYLSDVTVTLTATDDIMGVAKTEYSLDGTTWITYTIPFTITDEGITTVYYRSSDLLGNVEAAKFMAIMIDKTAPETGISLDGILGLNGWYISDVTVILTAWDAVSDVGETDYSFYGSTWIPYTGPFNITDKKITTVYYRSIDNAGNVEETKSVEVKIYIESQIDINPDTLNLKSKGKWITTYVTLPAGYNVNEIDVSSIELWYGDKSLTPAWGEVQDGVFMIKFDRAALIELIGDVGDNTEIDLQIWGEVAGMIFAGLDSIRVISRGK